jgi:nicotinamidase-related amidase
MSDILWLYRQWCDDAEVSMAGRPTMAPVAALVKSPGRSQPRLAGVPGRLPQPPHYDPGRVADVWRVDYKARFEDAQRFAREHDLRRAVDDAFRTALVVVDAQNTFCTPGFELFVGGRSGTGALDDSRRLCEFVYTNLGAITQIVPTLDTHQALQIFHPVFLVDPDGNHPGPYTLVSLEDVETGRWRVDPAVAEELGLDPEYAQSHLRHYVETLATGGKYALTIWPFHAMRAGIGHALVSSLEEAVFFHSIARTSQPDVQMKGNNPLTEHYSVLGPEVDTDLEGEPLGRRNQELIERLLRFDAVIIAGQAKSHCVAWTIADLLSDETVRDRGLAAKVYLLEDCTSPVVVPGVVDYTDEADAAFARFAETGAHVVRSTEPLDNWPGVIATAAV